MERKSDWPKEWSFENGAEVLSKDSSSEDRIIDAISLVSAFHADRQEEVIEALKPLTINGKTAKVRSEAVLGLSLLLSPSSATAIRDLLPEMDEFTRLGAERLLGAPGMGRTEAGKVPAPDSEKAGKWTEKRVAKLSAKSLKTAEKLRKGMTRHELHEVELAREIPITPDLAQGGIGYRIEIIPANEDAASFTIWVGIQGIRCGIGPRQASRRMRWVTSIDKKFWLVNTGSNLDLVVKGQMREWVAPDGIQSLATLPLPGKQVEPFRTSSEVTELHEVPDDWTEVEYPAYRRLTKATRS